MVPPRGGNHATDLGDACADDAGHRVRRQRIIELEQADDAQFFVLTGPTIIRTGGGLMNANLDEVTQLLEAQLTAYEAAANA